MNFSKILNSFALTAIMVTLFVVCAVVSALHGEDTEAILFFLVACQDVLIFMYGKRLEHKEAAAS